MDMHDFSEPLTQELLMDMADNFFGARTELENMMKLFSSYVEKLREKEAEVEGRVNFLNYLLSDKESISNFYKSLNADPAFFLSTEPFSNKPLPETIPFSLTPRGKFVNFVLLAYDALQKACDEHMNGKSDEALRNINNGEIFVYHKLIMEMFDLINEKVRHVNQNMSPLSVLQYAKGFDVGIGSRENITGGSTFGGEYGSSNINDKLAYSPIHFDSLQLKSYPDLPKQNKVISQITDFCKKIYSHNKHEIRRHFSELRESIHANA